MFWHFSSDYIDNRVRPSLPYCLNNPSPSPLCSFLSYIFISTLVSVSLFWVSAVDCIKMCSVINLLLLSSLHAVTRFHVSSVINLVAFMLLLCAATCVSAQNMQSDVFFIFVPFLSLCKHCQRHLFLILRQESRTPYNIKEIERERGKEGSVLYLGSDGEDSGGEKGGGGGGGRRSVSN